MTQQVGLMITSKGPDMTVGDVLAALEAMRAKIIADGYSNVLDKTWSVTPRTSYDPTCTAVMKQKTS